MYISLAVTKSIASDPPCCLTDFRLVRWGSHAWSCVRLNALHESVLKRIHVAARVRQPLHDSLGSPGNFQNASILAFVSPRFCLQSLSFAILRRLPFARRPISPPSFLVVPHSLSIPSIVRNLGKFSNSIPLLTIFCRRFLGTPFDPRPETRCNRRARPKETFCTHQHPSAPDLLRSLLSCSLIPYI